MRVSIRANAATDAEVGAVAEPRAGGPMSTPYVVHIRVREVPLVAVGRAVQQARIFAPAGIVIPVGTRCRVRPTATAWGDGASKRMSSSTALPISDGIVEEQLALVGEALQA